MAKVSATPKCSRDLNDILADRLDNALEQAGWVNLINQPYAQAVTDEAGRILDDEDASFGVAARWAVERCAKLLVVEKEDRLEDMIAERGRV